MTVYATATNRPKVLMISNNLYTTEYITSIKVQPGSYPWQNELFGLYINDELYKLYENELEAQSEARKIYLNITGEKL